MKKNYSRRIAVEERKNKKKALTFIVLSFSTILFLFFFGIPLIAKFASFVTDLTKKNTPIILKDNTPPAPPRFNNLPDKINKSQINISGNTEEGSVVTIFINGLDNEIISDNYGEFNFLANLELGENIIYATVKDQSGNKSTESKTYVINYDNEAPEIIINSPSDGENYYGQSQKEIEITGNTDPQGDLTINDRFITIDDDGNFKYKYSLNDGENTLTFKAIDKAQNETEKTITVSFTP
ncbi:MAG: hypothetical protein ABH819_01975 [Patescibacteria group bacterium]|nr:hypothetical protein [Patescibacteria group bacterium]